MRIQANNIRLQYNEIGKAELVLTTDMSRIDITKEKEVTQKGKKLSVDIKQYRKSRSLNANSYCWVLINEIANVLRTDQDAVYIEMLKRYGQREEDLLSVVESAADMVYRATKNHCSEVGESELNGKVFKHFKILRGSSQYDTREMSILIDGVISECKELGIETMTPDEIAALKAKWGSLDTKNVRKDVLEDTKNDVCQTKNKETEKAKTEPEADHK